MSFNLTNQSPQFWEALGLTETPDGTEQQLDDLLVARIVSCTAQELNDAMQQLSPEDAQEFGAQCALILSIVHGNVEDLLSEEPEDGQEDSAQ